MYFMCSPIDTDITRPRPDPHNRAHFIIIIIVRKYETFTRNKNDGAERCFLAENVEVRI